MCCKSKPNIFVMTNMETFHMNIYYVNVGGGVYAYFRQIPNDFQQITVY